MASEEFWNGLIEEMLVELSPRSDVDDVVNMIAIEDFTGRDSCTATVNAATWIEGTQIIETGNHTVAAENLGTTGIGEQKVTVQIIS